VLSYHHAKNDAVPTRRRKRDGEEEEEKEERRRVEKAIYTVIFSTGGAKLTITASAHWLLSRVQLGSYSSA
jgi:MarR-like DNA-binding transcriptional regulator SgrR of sgrS sRNA